MVSFINIFRINIDYGIFLGKVDYKAFAHLITTGAQEELAQA